MNLVVAQELASFRATKAEKERLATSPELSLLLGIKNRCRATKFRNMVEYWSEAYCYYLGNTKKELFSFVVDCGLWIVDAHHQAHHTLMTQGGHGRSPDRF